MRRLRWRRGGTYTLVVLASSALILLSGSLYVEATRNTFLRGVQLQRAFQAREAAFAGARWAAEAARGEPQGQGVLELAGGIEARVRWAPEAAPERLRVEVEVQGPNLPPQQLEATLARRDGAWRLVGYQPRP